MRMTHKALLALLPLAPLACPAALAKTLDVAAGADAQTRLQEALISAAPGDVVQIGAGRFALTDTLSLDAPGVTVRGAGMEATVLDFTGQQGGGQGMLVTAADVTLRDFAIENPKGDGIKSKAANNIVYYRIRVTWTGGPKATNGGYGIYPVESTNVLVDGSQVSGASDSGIYVGQSEHITIRNCLAEANVAGIEIENSRNALVEHNLVTRNTGGILVFDLPNLPKMGGGNVLVTGNLVVSNDLANFAPPGNIVASVRRGTGIMVMANDGVEVSDNVIDRNPTASVLLIAYPRAFTDARYNPLERRVTVGANRFGRGGYDPQLPGKDMLLKAFGGALPPVVWDGLGDTPALPAGSTALSLGLAKQGTGVDAAVNPQPLAATQGGKPTPIDRATVGAPAALDARIAS
jgi:parallel beta-helix repeat protein